MKRIQISLAICLACTTVFGQIQLSAPNQSQTIDFNDFTGIGFDPNPSSGQISSLSWAVTGMSDGALPFGGSISTGDLARGLSTGSESQGGLYAFDHGMGDVGLGVQPTGSDFSMATDHITLRVVNGLSVPITEIAADYEVWVLNDQDRSNAFNFSYSMDGENFLPVSALDYSSPATADPSPIWMDNLRSTTISGLYFVPGDTLYFRWSGGDLSGAGSRDEFALDDVRLTPLVDDVNAAFSYSAGCLGDPTDFTDLSYTINGTIAGWDWDFGDGNTSSMQNPQNTYNAGGIYEVTLIVTNSQAESDTLQMMLEIIPHANPVITAPDTACATAAPFKVAVSINGGVWQGSGFDNDSTSGFFDPTLHGAGTFVITYVIYGMCGGSDLDTIVVKSIADATLTISEDTLCSGSPAVQISTLQGTGVWSSNAPMGIVDPSQLAPGTHEITYSIDQFGCSDADTIWVAILEQKDASIDSIAPLCTYSPEVELAGTNDTTGIWSGIGVSGNAFDPAIAGVGNHAITYSLMGNCGDTQQMTVVVNTAPVVAIQSVAGSVCGNEADFLLQASPSGGLWSGSGIVGSAAGLFSPAAVTPGQTVLYYTVLANGCSSTDSVEYTVYPVPTASFTETVSGNNVTMSNTSTGASTYAWDFGDGSGISTLSSPSYQYSASGSYTVALIASNANGCADTAFVTVAVTTVGIADYAVNSMIQLYPNLVRNGQPVRMKCAGDLLSARLIGTDGRVAVLPIESTGFIHPTGLSAGVYHVLLITEEGAVSGGKLVVID